MLQAPRAERKWPPVNPQQYPALTVACGHPQTSLVVFKRALLVSLVRTKDGQRSHPLCERPLEASSPG